MPDEQNIRRIVQDELQRQGNRDTFGVSAVPRHTHNGIDSPFAFDPVAIYGGIIITSDTPATLPKGWTLEHIATGVTHVTHNLNDIDQIFWMAAPFGAGGATLPVPIIIPGPNLVEFNWFDANNAAADIDTTFFFIGVQVNNQDTTPAQYTVF